MDLGGPGYKFENKQAKSCSTQNCRFQNFVLASDPDFFVKKKLSLMDQTHKVMKMCVCVSLPCVFPADSPVSPRRGLFFLFLTAQPRPVRNTAGRSSPFSLRRSDASVFTAGSTLFAGVTVQRRMSLSKHSFPNGRVASL